MYYVVAFFAAYFFKSEFVPRKEKKKEKKRENKQGLVKPIQHSHILQVCLDRA